MNWRKWWWLILAVVVLIGYWFLPISGRVMVLPGADDVGIWPHFQFEGQPFQRGTRLIVRVTDVEPWPFVNLVVDGAPATPVGKAVEQAGTWTWTWHVTVPDEKGYTLVFYHDCHTGCIERGRTALGSPQASAMTETGSGLPTKLGLVMPHLRRDWHGRSGWAVEVTYALRAEESYWGVDDLAHRVAMHQAQGLRVLVRVEYEQRQSLPPTGDYMALTEYLAFFQRLASDNRLQGVYGYIVGSDYNTIDASALSPDRSTTPEWYARLFNGYGEEPTHTDNVLQIVRSENAATRVIVGPLRPWGLDAVEMSSGALSNICDGAVCYDGPDVPWLIYMDAIVRSLCAGSEAKAAVGVSLALPDGFDVQAPGRPDAPEMSGALRADEPATSLARQSWGGAEAGFRIYEDWIAVINAYPATRGTPIYIISTNTYDRETGIPPAQNYPKGWLTTAFNVVNAEPQIHALVWFLDDFPHGEEWDWFSLYEQPGRLVDAAEEFDALLELP